MTRIGFRSTLVFSLLSGIDASASAQQADSIATRPFWAAYVGGSLNGPFQFIAGGQVWLRTPLAPLSIVPELAIGHGTSLFGGVGAHLATSSPGTRLYLGLNAGYLWMNTDDVEVFSGFLFTPKAGFLLNAPGISALFGDKAVGLLLEYQGLDWFSLHRALIGARWSF
jgi:hypothetical protein